VLDLLLAAACFVAAVTTHVVYCRAVHAESPRFGLFLISSALWLIVYVWLVASRADSDREALFVSGLLLYALAVPSYLAFYLSAYFLSPSRAIVIALENDTMLSRDELLARLDHTRLIESRTASLLDNDLITIERERLALAPRGTRLARLLRLANRSLGIRGGG